MAFLRALRSFPRPLLVRAAHHGEGFLRALGLTQGRDDPRWIPHLMVCDRRMPRIGGDEVLARVRREDGLAHVPFLMLSSSAEASEVARSLAAGADDHVAKPIDYHAYRDLASELTTRWLPRDDPLPVVHGAEEAEEREVCAGPPRVAIREKDGHAVLAFGHETEARFHLDAAHLRALVLGDALQLSSAQGACDLRSRGDALHAEVAMDGRRVRCEFLAHHFTLA